MNKKTLKLEKREWLWLKAILNKTTMRRCQFHSPAEQRAFLNRVADMKAKAQMLARQLI